MVTPDNGIVTCGMKLKPVMLVKASPTVAVPALSFSAANFNPPHILTNMFELSTTAPACCADMLSAIVSFTIL